MVFMNERGFTLIEMIAAIGIFVIFVMIIVGAGTSMSGNSNISIGINGMMETRCVEGYKFIVDQDGRSRQILDELGKGVRCENPNAGKPGAFGRM